MDTLTWLAAGGLTAGLWSWSTGFPLLTLLFGGGIAVVACLWSSRSGAKGSSRLSAYQEKLDGYQEKLGNAGRERRPAGAGERAVRLSAAGGRPVS